MTTVDVTCARWRELIASIHRIAEALREEYEMIELLGAHLDPADPADRVRRVNLEEHQVLVLRHMADLIRVAGELHPDDCC